MSAAFLLSLRHLGCDHGVPADPTATRLTRQHLDQHNGILVVRRFSHGDRVPDTMTESWLCSGRAGSVPGCEQCLNHAGNVAECRQCPGHAGSVPACDCVPDTLAESRLCRQCPGVCLLNVSHCLLFPPETKCFRQVLFSSSPDPRSLHCFQSWSRAPIVTNPGDRED